MMMNVYQKFIAISRYARFIEEEQRRETVNKILSRLDEFTAMQEVQSLKKGIELYK